jgi:hypothetical protein
MALKGSVTEKKILGKNSLRSRTYHPENSPGEVFYSGYPYYPQNVPFLVLILKIYNESMKTVRK